jgi:hypothetical protein
MGGGIGVVPAGGGETVVVLAGGGRAGVEASPNVA